MIVLSKKLFVLLRNMCSYCCMKYIEGDSKSYLPLCMAQMVRFELTLQFPALLP